MIDSIAGARFAGRKDSGRSLARLLNRLEEFQQVGVDLICMRGSETVGQAWVKKFLGSLDELSRPLSRNIDRDDLVVLTMHDQGGYVELLEILVEVGLGKCLDAVVNVLETTLHAP